MKTQREVFNKLFKEEKVELSIEKVELARKPQSILSEANKLDSKLRGMESKIEKAYLNYKQNQKEWVSKLSDIEQDADRLEDDLVKILDAAQEIGVDGRQIDGFSKAADLITVLQRIANDGKKLYPSVK
jgi:TolA-binding protein